MTNEVKDKILALKRDGMEIVKIAGAVELPPDTVRTFLSRFNAKYERCRWCEKEIPQQEHRKKKLFCSDECRLLWWNAHKGVVRRKAYYHFVCPYCGREFTAYGNSKRKYCSRGCYANARRKEADSERKQQPDEL